VKPYLFVYGTLTKSHPRLHERLVGAARYLGRGTIAGTLYDLGRYPGAFRNRKRQSRVTGELYELEGPDIRGRLRALDRYEGAQFKRSRVKVRLSNGDQRLAWAYLLAEAPPGNARPLPSGIYRPRAA
jgi:gamma-glutamylcyclotransferase (GGCT)/AIG2-like uncharacterized protein YtfP